MTNLSILKKRRKHIAAAIKQAEEAARREGYPVRTARLIEVRARLSHKIKLAQQQKKGKRLFRKKHKKA